MSLPSFSVRNSVLANMLMCVILAAGMVFAFTLQREMFPDSRPEKLLVTAVYPGVQPEDVEKSVTIKIEEALRGLEGVEKIESQVTEGATFTTLTLAQTVDDVDVLLQEVRNEVDTIQDIPEDVEKISLRKVEPQLPIIAIAVFSDEGEKALKKAAQDLRDELLKLPGVSRVAVNGIRNDEIYVDVIPDKLLEYDITFTEIANAIRAENVDISGGQLKGQRSSVAVRTIGEEQFAERLGDIVVKSLPEGRQVRLTDVATLTDGFVDSDQEALFNARPSVDCVVFSAKGEDAVQISSVVKAYFAGRSGDESAYTGPAKDQSQLYAALGRPDVYSVYEEAKNNPFPESIQYQLHTDVARFVEGRLDLMVRNGRVGLLLVLLSLNLFLNWRVAFWAAMGLLISFMGTFAVMWALGATVNLLSMFGLIVVLGIIVDDAIVIGENIYRHVENGVPPIEAAIKGAEEVMWPVIVAVSTTIGAFFPLFFIQGQIGDFMAQLPLVVIAALSISLVEALVILPAHLRHLKVPKPDLDEDGMAKTTGWKDHILKHWLQAPYERLLRISLRWRYITTTIVVAATIVSFGMLAGGIVKARFIQDMDSESIICALEMPIGTTTERLKQELDKLNGFIVTSGKFPEVVNVQTIAGRQYDVTGAGSVGFEDQSHLGQVVIEICPAEERTKSSEQLVGEFREFSNTQLQGINSVRWEAMNGGPGGNDIEINIAGLSNEDLPRALNDIKQLAARIEGVYDLDDNLDIGKRELKLRLNDSAAASGITSSMLGMHVRGALFGQEARRISRNREDVKIMVRYPKEFRDSPWNVETMWIPGPASIVASATVDMNDPAAGARANSGDRLPARRWIPVKEIAQLESGLGYATITRYQQSRSAKVLGAVDKSKDLTATEVVAKIREQVDAKIVPKYPGIDVQYLGQAEEIAKSFSSLKLAFPVACLIIYGMLAGLFKSYTQPVVVMCAIPFGVLGAIVGHWLTNETFTILSAIGLVALAGILVNDSLVLVDFINRRIDNGLSPFEANVDGAKKRLRAILLTTLTTAAGLIPLMFEKSFQAKFLIPMAVTLTFGLLFATALTLVMVPCLNMIRDDILALFGYSRKPRAKTGSSEEDDDVHETVMPDSVPVPG